MAGTPITCGNETRTFDRIDGRFRQCRSTTLDLGASPGNRAGGYYVEGHTLDLWKLYGRQGNRCMFFSTVLVNQKARVVEFSSSQRAGIEGWLNRRRIAEDTVLRLAPGQYHLFLRATIGKLPPVDMEKRSMIFAPRFNDVLDPQDVFATWVGKTRRLMPILEQLMALAPESSIAARARFAFKAAGISRDDKRQ